MKDTLVILKKIKEELAGGIGFDFDGVLTDYDNEAARRNLSVKELKFKKDVFSNLPPLGEAIEKINELNTIYPDQIRFLTAASFLRPESWSEKVYWYKKHFLNFHKKLIITSDKGACGTESDILVDDNPTWNGADRFKGPKFKFKYTDHGFAFCLAVCVGVPPFVFIDLLLVKTTTT